MTAFLFAIDIYMVNSYLGVFLHYKFVYSITGPAANSYSFALP